MEEQPSQPQDPKSAAPPIKRQILWQLSLRIVVLSILLTITILLQGKSIGHPFPPLTYVAYFVAGVYIFTIISAILLRYVRRRFVRFAYIQIIIDALLTACLIYSTGGSQSIFTVIYFFPIITGALMLFRRGGLFIASVCTLSYGTIIALEYMGRFPNYFPVFWTTPLTNLQTAMHQFAIPGLSFFLVAVLSTLLSERLRWTEAALSRTSLDYGRLVLLYKQIFDDITTGIITVDSSGKISSFNRAAEEITGFSDTDVVGNMIEDYFPDLKSEKSNQIRPVVSITRKDGEKIPVGYSWAKLNMPRESEGDEDWRVFTMQDLSKIKKMEDQVRQAEKMAAIGEMAAGVAHEFRNPIAAISGATQMLSSEFEAGTPNQRLINIIVRECDRLTGTISHFLQFSKPVMPEKKWFSMNGLVNETLLLLKQTPNWNNIIRVKTDIPENLDCWADPRQIKQVLLNLINNASHAFKPDQPENQEIFIKADEFSAENKVEKTWIEIRDTGSGIPDKIKKKIFDPFFTTRENGTGLGLAIVRQIIESHGGEIQVTSKEGEGTCFVIRLPLPRV